MPSTDPIVHACKGPKPNSQHITKTDGLYERRVSKHVQLNKQNSKNAVIESMSKVP